MNPYRSAWHAPARRPKKRRWPPIYDVFMTGIAIAACIDLLIALAIAIVKG